MCIVWWFAVHIHCEMIATIKLINTSVSCDCCFLFVCFLVSLVRMHTFYTLSRFQIYKTEVSTSHHSVHYIFRTYSSYNWKFVPFDQHLPQGPENHHPILFLWVWHFFFFPDSAWYLQYLSLFQDITLSMMPSGLIHVVTNGRISFFFMTVYIIHTHTHTHVCIKWEI